MRGSEQAQEAGKKRRRGLSPAKTAATRRALIEAGLSTFLENGLSGTRMIDVAARAGVAKGTVYLHFPDKNALFAEVLREFVRSAAGERPIGRPKRDETTHHFLQRTVVPVLRELQAKDRFRVLFLVITEGMSARELATIYRAEAINPVMKFVRILLARAERRSELKSIGLLRQPALFAAPVVLGTVWNSLFARGDTLDVAGAFAVFIDLAFIHEQRGHAGD